MGPAAATCNRHRPERDERSLVIQWCSDDPRQVPITTITGTRGRITGHLIEHCGPEGRRSHPPYYRASRVAASVVASFFKAASAVRNHISLVGCRRTCPRHSNPPNWLSYPGRADDGPVLCVRARARDAVEHDG